MNTFAIGSFPVHFSVAKLFNFRWQYTHALEMAIMELLENEDYIYTSGDDIHKELSDVTGNVALL